MIKLNNICYSLRTQSSEIRANIMSFRHNLCQSVLSDCNTFTITMNELITVYLPFKKFISSFIEISANTTTLASQIVFNNDSNVYPIEEISEF